MRFNDIVSNEIGASTDNSQDFFSKDIDSNIVLVRLTGEDDLIDNTTTINSSIITGLTKLSYFLNLNYLLKKLRLKLKLKN